MRRGGVAATSKTEGKYTRAGKEDGRRASFFVTFAKVMCQSFKKGKCQKKEKCSLTKDELYSFFFLPKFKDDVV